MGLDRCVTDIQRMFYANHCYEMSAVILFLDYKLVVKYPDSFLFVAGLGIKKQARKLIIKVTKLTQRSRLCEKSSRHSLTCSELVCADLGFECIRRTTSVNVKLLNIAD